MALITSDVGSGAGGTAGVGKGLTYTGDFGYAYSGAIPLNNETKTFILFKTGNFIYSSVTQLTGVYANMGSSKQLRLIISLNGTIVLQQAPMTASNMGAFDYDAFNLIIPPYTEVKIEVSTNDTGDIDFFVTMTGRVYR